MNKHTGGYISKLTFNDNSTLDIQNNSIVVFVGPNNAGKSQSLNDIYRLSKEKLPSVVISDIEITKYKLPISNLLNSLSKGKDYGSYMSYSLLNNDYNIFSFSDTNFIKSHYHENFRNLFVANLDTSTRLKICDPPNNITRNDPKFHPIHYSEFDSSYRKWLSENFKKAFGIELIPNSLYGSKVPLCIGSPVQLNDTYKDEQERLEAYGEILNNYNQVQNQGDGIKSFTGILLYLMLKHYCTYLIDEPESFLHPPQARIMGQIIGQSLSEYQQAFISTHSEDLIKGLIESAPDRIKIVRITRNDNTNKFSIIDSEKIDNIWNDSLLKHSNIMSSLFHNSVVLCESDSDCKLYSIIENHIKQTNGSYSETLFIHCGGKHKMPKVISALTSLNINIKIIPDMDILNDKNIFRKVVESVGINWENIENDYRITVANINSDSRNIHRNDIKSKVNEILDSSNNQILSKEEISEIRKLFNTNSKWEDIKKYGTQALSRGDSTCSFNKLNSLLQSHGIFIVKYGELESFIKEVGGHGPEWVNNVLEKYPDLNDDVYNSIKTFINSLNL